MSTDRLANPNSLLAESADLLAFAEDPANADRVLSVRLDWVTGKLHHIDDVIRSLLLKRQWLYKEDGIERLTDQGLSFLAKFLINFGALLKTSPEIAGKYILENVLASGKNSVTFKACHKTIGRYFALKFFRPGRGKTIIKNLPRIGQVKGEPYLVHPIDVFPWNVQSINGQPVSVWCLVFPFIEGETLESFLRGQRPISPYFIQSYLEQVANALSSLENQNLFHGDLHSNNILLTIDKNNAVNFRVIDVSFGVDEPSSYEYRYTDFQYFKEHLIRTLWNLQKHLKRMSLQKHLGARLFTLIQTILSSDKMSFKEIVHLLQDNKPFQLYKQTQTKFTARKFTKPTVLGLLRYEEIIDPTIAVNLFVPFKELFNEISQFGSAVVFGHRGSGKSTYLASMAFFPSVDRNLFDFKQKFGVFFACRQGEFKQFNSEMLQYTPKRFLVMKHILVLKIIRRIIDLLNRSVEFKRLDSPTGFSPLTTFLKPYVRPGVTLEFPSATLAQLDNLHASLLRNEIAEIDALLVESMTPVRLLGETELIEFLAVVRRLFPALQGTQFYLLFDDAGQPNLPMEVQMVLNELLRCVNSSYCVKISAERFCYHFQAADSKIIEDPHDYITFNISKTLSLGSGRSPERKDVKQYFEKLVAKRLHDSSFKSENVSDYLGEEIISIDRLVSLLASHNKRSAYFCGWNMVWQLADRTTRHLLEIISTIFAAAHVDDKSNPAVIRPYVQHKAIKDFSENKLKSLNFIPGSTYIDSMKVGIGKQMYEFAAAFGKVAFLNLKRGPMVATHSRKRFHEKLAIEIDGELKLDEEAKIVLEQLIRYAVIDDSKLAKAFDDQTKKPIYVLNRIYCPALGISFRRESHWRLSSKRFQHFLLHPLSTVRDGDRLLKDDLPKNSGQLRII